jgi:hypothetical protein
MMSSDERRSVAEVLEADAEAYRSEARRLRELADGMTIDAHRKRAKADAIELQAVESLAAANILREAGLRADRTSDGTPRIQVDRVLIPAPDTTDVRRT